VAALSDVNNQVVEAYSYDVFGEPNRVSDVNNPYYFTARRLDPETDNYYYRARYYHPEIGRFLQPDPIGYDDGLNMYTYVGNNPINWIDPFGLYSHNNQGGHHWNLKDTLGHIRRARRSYGWCPQRHGNLFKVRDSVMYDYAHNRYRKDTFTILTQGGKKETISAAQFGNYMAGYMCTYKLGYMGYIGARLAGNKFATRSYFKREDQKSIDMINRGADAAMHEPDYPFLEGANPDKIVWYFPPGV